jgi:hypothetical protein
VSIRKYISSLIITLLSFVGLASAGNYTPAHNYSKYVNVIFGDTGESQSLSVTTLSQRSLTSVGDFMPIELFWCVMLSIPFIFLYGKQHSTKLCVILYLFIGAVLRSVMPPMITGFVFLGVGLGITSIIYNTFNTNTRGG